MLTFTSTTKSYGSREILSIPSLQLDSGIYWLQGANGSGKTTLLRMIAGLLPFKGDIHCKGFSQRKDRIAYRRSVSWADAEPLYPDFLKGQDLIAFYQEVRKAPTEQVSYLTDCLQVRSYLGAPVGTYSSGMVKRLSLVLAFIGRPSLITLDEPLVTLDKEIIPALYHLIAVTYREHNSSFLISSHQDLARGSLPEEQILSVHNAGLELLPNQSALAMHNS